MAHCSAWAELRSVGLSTVSCTARAAVGLIFPRHSILKKREVISASQLLDGNARSIRIAFTTHSLTLGRNADNYAWSMIKSGHIHNEEEKEQRESSNKAAKITRRYVRAHQPQLLTIFKPADQRGAVSSLRRRETLTKISDNGGNIKSSGKKEFGVCARIQSIKNKE